MTNSIDGELGDVIGVIEIIVDPLITFNLFLSFFSIFINSLHLIILTRPSLKASSTNVIMIGIALVDIFTLLLTVIKHISLVDIENNECVTSNSLFKMHLDMILWGLQDYFRRCSTWLGLSMAVVRAVIVKETLKKSNSKLTNPKLGWLTIFFILILASIPSAFYNIRFNITENRETSLPISCEEFQDIHSPPRFSMVLSDLFADNEKIVLRTYLMIDAIISKFIPCALFPFLTCILISGLSKAKKVRRKSNLLDRPDPTTKLVIAMTVSFFIAEAPLGVINMINAIYYANDGIIIASVDVIIVFACLLTINSTCHFILCICLSRQYRSTLYYTLNLDRLVLASNIQNNADTRNMSNMAVPSIRLVSVK